ncbi:hypothetical protein [uncultured Oscillibacter sp.]|uniref:hypothetical protein n=1 Tax=uncultured Oscillibacter sp. TaxID=876091 RepID=UPI0025CEBFF2|nr:hypothetical protein [uncultured Oscillibacter sp.]
MQFEEAKEPNIYFVNKLSVKSFMTEAEKDLILSIKENHTALDKAINEDKDKCKEMLQKSHIALNEAIHNFSGKRILPRKKLNKNVVNISPSALTRALKWQDRLEKSDDVFEDIIIVTSQAGKMSDNNAHKILMDLVLNGFILDDKEYIFLTASAGQIRNQEMMFIQKAKYDEIYNTISCGLSWDKINSTQDKEGNYGIITNKYMAYLALSASSSKYTHVFSIDHCIVVDDFESDVTGTVDYVQVKQNKKSVTLSGKIERNEMKVSIPHSDGCGIILDSKSNEAFTVRGPWIKGLLVPFKFDRFIEEADQADPSVNHGLVQDIYGDWHDILNDKIEVIFTKSQFKMSKYYANWDEYKSNFKKYGCEFSKCKTQSETVKSGKLSYQFLQTLTDFPDKELKTLVGASNEHLKSMCRNPIKVWKAHNSKDGSQRPLWNAVGLYPELFSDPYTVQEISKEAVSFHDNALGGRLIADGMNTFLAPDLYAFCEHLFLNKSEPQGLIKNGQVSCSLYKDGERLDCLRSPHWDRAHALRTNCRDKNCKEWFSEKVCFLSCHDLITKILQNDCDGDTTLLCNDKTLISVAERNTINDVPLYYKMPKGKPQKLSNEAFYNGMLAAYKYSIGMLANPITKLWNSTPFNDSNLDIIKLFTAESNFFTDYAKTLFAPTLPKKAISVKSNLKNMPLPWFWSYTKNFKKLKKKKDAAIEDSDVSPELEEDDENKETTSYREYIKSGIRKDPSDSTVDRIGKYLEDKRRINVNLYAVKTGLGKFNYRMLMSDQRMKDADINCSVIAKYDELKGKYSTPEVYIPKDQLFRYKCENLKGELLKIEPDEAKVADMLIIYLFGEENKNARKAIFWQCFGEQVKSNLSNNLSGTKVCHGCLTHFKPQSDNQMYCPACRPRNEKSLPSRNHRSIGAKLTTPKKVSLRKKPHLNGQN